MDDPNWWLDPDSPWWTKLARAWHHIDDLDGEVNAFSASGSYEVVPEHGEPGETVYRLRVTRPIPAYFGAIIGDALHNLRSALDCAAFELARRHVGRDLAEDEERACHFPIIRDRAELAAFFRPRVRQELYGPQEQRAIRDVQPGWVHDYLTDQGRQAPRGRRETEVGWDQLTLLSRLNNLDKHRRLHLVGWRLDLVYWTSDGPARRGWRWAPPPFTDGAILGTLIDDPAHPEPLPDVRHEMQLRMQIPPLPNGDEHAELIAMALGNTDAVRVLTGIHRQITVRVFPRPFKPSGFPTTPPSPDNDPGHGSAPPA